jgi:hypothetical protein
MRRISFFGCLLGVLLTAGCASIDSRIKKNQAVFNSFPTEVQALVRQEKVRVGFTSEMAAIALGLPRRKYKRTTAAGDTEIWAYVERKTRSETVPVRSRFSYQDSNGRYRRAYDTDYVTVDSYVEFDRLRLEFVNGKIEAIEEVTQ